MTLNIRINSNGHSNLIRVFRYYYMKFILGKKIEMTQLFDEVGNVIPATILEVGPCTVAQIKSQETDGYSAIQIGYDKKKNLSKALRGHLKDLENFRWLREFDNSANQNLKRGDEITLENFNVGDLIAVIGTSKGKGFQGVVRRHGFHGHPSTHGHKDQLRMPGSIGSKRTGSVAKGKRMAGHMGAEQITVKNLEIIKIDLDKKLIYVKGAVPGRRGSLVEIVGEGELKIKNQQQAINNEQNQNNNETQIIENIEKAETPETVNDNNESNKVTE